MVKRPANSWSFIMKKKLYRVVYDTLDNLFWKFYDDNREEIIEGIYDRWPDAIPAGDEWDDNDITEIIIEYIERFKEQQLIDYIFSQENNK